MPDPFRFVIIGSGNIASTYVQALGNVPEARLVGIVSRSGHRPSRLAGEAPLEIGAALRDVKGPFEAVIVATPNGLHHDGILQAASRNCHVLTEKPLEVSVREADRCINACRRAGVTLGVCFQRRMSPDNIAVKALIDAGELGKILAADLAVKFFRDQAYYDSAPYRGGWAMDGGGSFMQQASHQVDLYGWFFGPPREVRAMTATLAHRMEAEDHGAALLQHDSGMIGTIVASTAARPGFPARLEIHAQAGSLTMENDVITKWMVEGIPNPSRPLPAAGHSGAGAGGAAVSDTTGHEAIIADFIAAVRDHRPPAVSGEQARAATELIQRIYKAAGRPWR